MSAPARTHHPRRRRTGATPAHEPPSLRAVAELLHRAAASSAGPVLATVAEEPPGSLALGLWPVPTPVGHPTDPLIGLRAPASWSAIGLVASGTLRSLDRPAATTGSLAVTVLTDRLGATVSVLGEPHGELQVIESPPEGWGADALARVLDRPTPPPADPPSLWLEAAWLDGLAADLLARPDPSRSWAWLARRHPLVGTGPVPEPDDLARRTAAHAAAHPWSALRLEAATAVEALVGPDAVHPPPPAEVVAPAEWFDDGSYARWLLRQLPPPEVLLPDLVAVLDRPRGLDLLAALTAVSTALVVEPPA